MKNVYLPLVLQVGVKEMEGREKKNGVGREERTCLAH